MHAQQCAKRTQYNDVIAALRNSLNGIDALLHDLFARAVENRCPDYANFVCDQMAEFRATLCDPLALKVAKNNAHPTPDAIKTQAVFPASEGFRV
jgi:hypothetical protein